MSPFLLIHVGTGSLGFLSGAVALTARKGDTLHRVAGTVFFLAMLTTAASASILALGIHQNGNAVGGIFTFYLVATAWATVRRTSEGIGIFDFAGVAVAAAAAAAEVGFGLQAVNSPTGQLDGLPPPPYFLIGMVAALAALSDAKVIFRGGISGAPRIARHLWRMCFALFVAVGSSFAQIQKFLPAFLHGWAPLVVVSLAVLSLMFFWLIRVRFTNWARNAAVAS
jgi:hypothetical protein